MSWSSEVFVAYLVIFYRLHFQFRKLSNIFSQKALYEISFSISVLIRIGFSRSKTTYIFFLKTLLQCQLWKVLDFFSTKKYSGNMSKFTFKGNIKIRMAHVQWKGLQGNFEKGDGSFSNQRIQFIPLCVIIHFFSPLFILEPYPSLFILYFQTEFLASGVATNMNWMNQSCK